MNDQERDLTARLHRLSLPAAPESLLTALEDIVSEPARMPRRRRRPIAFLAVAAVIGGATLAYAIGGASPNRRETPPPPVAVHDPSPRPTETEMATPSEDAGLNAYTVSELLEKRSRGDVSGEPLELTGYWSYVGLMHSCAPPDGQPGDLEIYCHDGEYGITERKEPMLAMDRHGNLLSRAAGPKLTPWLPNEERVLPLLSLGAVNGQAFPPVPIVVRGHFDDPRAADCRPEARQICLDRFVVDEIVEFDPGSGPTPGISAPPTPFPFDSPPPPVFAVGDCAGNVGEPGAEFDFVGWIAGEELDLTSGLTFEDETMFVAITKDVVPLGDWYERQGDDQPSRPMGRLVCLAHEWDEGSIQYDSVRGSTYLLYQDGTRSEWSGR